MSEDSTEKILIIGVGNEAHSDDGVGRGVARRLEDLRGPEVEVNEQLGEGPALMETWKGFQTVIVIDAVDAGATPGAVFRFDAAADSLPPDFFCGSSTRGFSLTDAIELGRALDELPERLTVYGIQVANLQPGEVISGDVAKAAEEVAEKIREEISGGHKKSGK